MTSGGGDAGADVLVGGPGMDALLNAGPGNDLLRGGPGADALVGSTGSDRLLGNAGPDMIDGGRSTGLGAADTDRDVVGGGTGRDTCFQAESMLRCEPGPRQRQRVTSCQGARPTIVGTPGRDAIVGSPGRDVIAALGGDDVVIGGNGNDVICRRPGKRHPDRMGRERRPPGRAGVGPPGRVSGSQRHERGTWT
jgi:Ca2+-binding RTX toxin-like protein